MQQKEKKRNHYQHQPRQQHNYDDDNLVREVHVASGSSPPRALGENGIIMVVKRMKDVSTTCLSQYPRMVVQSFLPDNFG